MQLRENIANGIIFYSAATIGKEDKLEFLLSKSFSPNFNIDENGPYNTPLLIAAVAKNTKAIKILIEYGADINYVNKSGYSLKRVIRERNIKSLSNIFQ
ncbi:ankyrin repeat domain-containing protein [Marinobacterium stanieri]|uniref:ankyrin repeat domain-containing protein n=1 Tax=Marinobacterium stanieri TaxID=49186 RepID=UPI0009DA61AE